MTGGARRDRGQRMDGVGMVSAAAFWGSAALLAYTYVVFPLLTLLRARVVVRPYRRAAIHPFVTIIVPAHDELPTIGRKIQSLLELDYPADRLEIVIASDGSTDGTNELVAGIDDPRVRLLALPRTGKGGTLNTAVEASRGSILVFSDATSTLRRESLARLVAPFADPEVGGVAGNQVYRSDGEGDAAAVGERRYWAFDRLMKLAQSRSGHAIAATGALYAVRRELYRPIAEGLSDDFITSLRVIEAGRRLVFEPGAVADEPIGKSTEVEFGRKVRIMTRGLRCVAAVPSLLNPLQYGFYAIELLSHKVLMRVMAVPLLVLGLATIPLARRGKVYRLAAAGQVAFYGLGIAGNALRHRAIGRHPVLSLPGYFLLVNTASLLAIWNLLSGRRIDRWDTRR